MNAARLLALYEQVAEARDAIPRLRRFVLDLAVRGKLVAQDPRDEPASELLKRIAAEKARLQIKYSDLPLGDDEVPFELPAGWSWTRVGEICSKTGSGSTPRGGKDVYRNSGIPFLRSQNVYNEGLRLDDVAFIDVGTHERMQGTRVLAGDLLLNITGGSIGRCARVPEDFEDANVSQHVAIIRPAVRGMDSFLHSLVLSPYFQAFIFDEQTGAGRGGLPKNRMDQIAVALPPIAEQRRIVAKVEELLALLDRLEAARTAREATRDRLSAASLNRLTAPDTIPEVFPAHARFALDALPALTTRRDQIKSLRQTILNLAVRGKLVEQELNAEPVPSVLQRFNATGSREGAFHLPGTWVWIDVGSVAKTRLGKMLDKAKNRGTPRPYLRNINVRWFDFDLSDLLEMPFENSELEEFSLLVGDVLICEGGEPGRAAVWDARSQGIYFQKAIHRVRFFAPADPHFFVLALKASADDGRLAESFTGTGIKHFTGKGLSGYRFPLPPLAEQHRIVAKVDELMALCDRLEASLATADTTKQRLLEALVQQALEPILKEAA